MNTTMFLPKKIKVGFQSRGDTYTKKLAYVVYFDEQGKLRKEKSFESWRDQKIEAEVFENEPTSGFVLNKKAGGYNRGWNHRQTYVRVYDPRGFEFEISVENLLYILDNTSSIVGKGLEGEFVYAWSGAELVLLPVNAPEYNELKKLNEIRHEQNFVKAKDLVVGATYLRKDNEKMVFLGKFDTYDAYYDLEFPYEKKEKKHFYFAYATPRRSDDSKTVKYDIEAFSAITKKFIQVLDENEHESLPDMIESMEGNRSYCPIDTDKTILEAVKKSDFLKHFENETYFNTFDRNGTKYTVNNWNDAPSFRRYDSWVGDGDMYLGKKYENLTLNTIFEILSPHTKHFYLKNGRYFTTEGEI